MLHKKRKGKMRKKILKLVLVFLIVIFYSINVMAQAEEPKAPLYIVEDTVVKPSKISEYEVHVKMAIELFKKYDYPYPVYNCTTDDFHYISIFPLKNYADMENTYKATGELAKKAGEEWQAMIKSADGTLEYSKYFMLRYIPQLSYIPEEPRLKPEESSFMQWEFFYVLPGKEMAFVEFCKKLVALYKEKNIQDGWELYSGSIGTETPLFIVLLKGKNRIDYYSNWEKILEILGEEGLKLFMEDITPLLRKFEYKTVKVRPDITYIPKEE
jgi:hypothetical protein